MDKKDITIRGIKFRVWKLSVRHARPLVLALAKHVGKLADGENDGFSRMLEGLSEADLDLFEKKFRLCSEAWVEDNYYTLEPQQVFDKVLDTDLATYFQWLIACGKENFADFLVEAQSELGGLGSEFQSTSTGKSTTRLSPRSHRVSKKS